jgi:hypothetical protein
MREQFSPDLYDPNSSASAEQDSTPFETGANLDFHTSDLGTPEDGRAQAAEVRRIANETLEPETLPGHKQTAVDTRGILMLRHYALESDNQTDYNLAA